MSGKNYEVSGDTTEWDDILIKKGITTKENVLLAKGLNPDDFKEDSDDDILRNTSTPTLEEKLACASLNEIDELEEDEDDDRMLQIYRERRIADLKAAQQKNKFGDVNEVSKGDWMKEVTEDSKNCWVVTHLFQDALVECQLMDETLRTLAKKFPAVKFLRIQSTHAVENWPERNLPTLFLYHEGELQHQVMTLHSLGGTAMVPDDLEWWLASRGVVETELEEKPHAEGERTRVRTTRIRSDRRQHEDYSDDDSI